MTDFHELFHFNFATNVPQNVPRPPLNTVEAVRLIMMELRATHATDPGPEDGQDLPVVHFTGTARSLHASWDPNANSNIRGTVRQTKEGEIRWTSLSVFNGYVFYWFLVLYVVYATVCILVVVDGECYMELADEI